MSVERLTQVIIAPIVSEKASRVADKHRQIVFKVALRATKKEIKAAVQKFFEVVVLSVRVVRMKGKQKMFRHRPGKRQDWKKAYVTLKEGHDISFVGKE